METSRGPGCGCGKATECSTSSNRMNVHHQLLTVRGVPVKFPVAKKPFSPQLAFMSQTILALSTGRSALLESPTGTGKTLALLCSVLSWQEHQFNSGGTLARPGTKLAPVNGQPLPVEPSSTATKRKRKHCKVFFMSRTHSQLSQVVREMKVFKALLSFVVKNLFTIRTRSVFLQERSRY